MNWQQEQAQFWDWINHPRDLNEDAQHIESVLAPHSRLSQAEALSIYNNAYHQRLVEVSSALFPILFNTLGRELYTQLWIGYMGKYPPRNGPIHRIGESLLTHVREHEQFRDLPAVADIVELESLLIALFDKADEVPFTLSDLQALPPDDWPATRWQAKQDWALMFSRFDLEDYWRKMQDFMASGAEPGSAEFGLQKISAPCVEGRPNQLVYRKQHRMQFQSVSPELSMFLVAVQNGACFADICSTLAVEFPDQDTPQLSLNLLLKTLELELLCR